MEEVGGPPRRSSKIGGHFQSKLPIVKKQRIPYVKVEPPPNTQTTRTARKKTRDVKPALPWTSNGGTMTSSRDSSLGFKTTYKMQSALCQDLEHIRFDFDNVGERNF